MKETKRSVWSYMFLLIVATLFLTTGSIIGIILAIIIFLTLLASMFISDTHPEMQDYNYNLLPKVAKYAYYRPTLEELKDKFQTSEDTNKKEDLEYELADTNSPKPTRQDLFEEIDSMDGYEFEVFMKKVYESLGYSVHHTPHSRDQGADLILTSNEGIRTAVQLKRYSHKVSNDAVQQVLGAKGYHRCTKGMVVTNSYYTDSAVQLAKTNDINIVDRDGLRKLLAATPYIMCHKTSEVEKSSLNPNINQNTLDYND